MKASELFFPTLREVPAEAEVVSHQLLLRAGFIRKASGGVYSYLPLAYRVIKKIMNIVREEMDRAGGQEVMLPIIQPRELWEKSGRWDVYGDEMFRLQDRHKRDFALGPTHEEIITTLVDGDIHSYRGLPLLLYQIQNKYRDEIRPRFGLMRGREFIMKDAYSFDLDDEGLEVSYRKMYHAYHRIFQRLRLEYRVVEADSGAIGGNESLEFMVLADNGESEIVYCQNCDYAADVEKAVCQAGPEDLMVELGERQKKETIGMKTVQDVAKYLNIPESQVIKTLLYLADGKPVVAVVRGDRELNVIKFQNTLGCFELVMADEKAAKECCGASFGSLGPVGLDLPVYADLEVQTMRNMVCGANENDFHYVNVNQGRDFAPLAWVDIRNGVAGDPCPQCQSPLQMVRGIESGQIFKLGDKYSKALGAAILDQNGESRTMIMGCYGIGVSRTMAAAVEQKHDDQGIIWPLPIAPFQVIVVPVNSNKEDQMKAAQAIYDELSAKGIEVLLDDRDERAGVKFKDADLIGIPLRITIGPRALQENKVEIKKRWEDSNELVPRDTIVEKVEEILKG
ncbi:MAG TPA: proline--tRNA ligase [Syntrophomonadaceae bacterium]|nr:proline--tRNA ligase [Syntrophomonadaceae bacterium]